MSYKISGENYTTSSASVSAVLFTSLTNVCQNKK